MLTGHSECGLVRTRINATRRATDALALIASRRTLPYDRYLTIPFLAIAILMTVHRNVTIRTIRCTLTASNAVVFDHNLFVPFAEDGVDRTANEAIRIGA